VDPEVRVIHHNTTEKGYTSRYRPWRPVFKKEYSTNAEAEAAEPKLKGMKRRSMIERIIGGERDI
jgi:putative endonuclease